MTARPRAGGARHATGLPPRSDQGPTDHEVGQIAARLAGWAIRQRLRWGGGAWRRQAARQPGRYAGPPSRHGAVDPSASGPRPSAAPSTCLRPANQIVLVAPRPCRELCSAMAAPDGAIGEVNAGGAGRRPAIRRSVSIPAYRRGIEAPVGDAARINGRVLDCRIGVPTSPSHIRDHPARAAQPASRRMNAGCRNRLNKRLPTFR